MSYNKKQEELINIVKNIAMLEKGILNVEQRQYIDVLELQLVYEDFTEEEIGDKREKVSQMLRQLANEKGVEI